jgi:signal peptidase I
MAPSPASARRAVLATAGGLGRAVIGLVCLVLIATLIPPLLGYQRFVVVGGSMEPTIHRGSVIFDEVVPVEDLRPGDVITYVPPGRDTPSTHRIISRELDAQGSWRFRTKGDANPQPDAVPFVLERPVQARVKLAIPYVGYLWMGLASKELRYALLVAPAILIALWILVSMWRDAGRLLEQERA